MINLTSLEKRPKKKGKIMTEQLKSDTSEEMPTSLQENITETTPKVNIYKKLHLIMTEADYIQKDKKNAFHGYTYASEAAIKELMHGLLVKHGVLFLPITARVSERTDYTSDKGKRSALTDVNVCYKFVDIDSGEEFEGMLTGTGDDSADKGTYKAITGAIKYILTSTFLIPTGDDPEEEAIPAKAQTKSSTPPQLGAIAFKYKEQIQKALNQSDLDVIGSKIKTEHQTFKKITDAEVKILQKQWAAKQQEVGVPV